MELYISTIVEMAIYWTPMGLMLCDGKKLQVKDHPALFSLVGSGYGGDASGSYFCLPDFRPLDEHGQRRNWHDNEPKKFIVVDGIYPTRDN